MSEQDIPEANNLEGSLVDRAGRALEEASSSGDLAESAPGLDGCVLFCQSGWKRVHERFKARKEQPQRNHSWNLFKGGCVKRGVPCRLRVLAERLARILPTQRRS